MTLPYYPFYWGDYSAKTFDLTQGQHGAYMLLLRHIYCTGRPIPHKHRFNIAKATLSEEQGNVDFILTSYFSRQGDEWHNLRSTEIMNEQQEKHEKLVNAGKKGGRPTHKETKPRLSHPSTDAKARPKQPEPEPKLVVFSSAEGWDSIRDLLCDAAGWQTARANGQLEVIGPITALIDAGADLMLDVLPVIKRDVARCRKPNWQYFVPAIAQARDDRLAAGTLKTAGLIHAPRQSKSNTTIADSFAVIDAAIANREREIAEAQDGAGGSGENPKLLS